MHSSEGADSEGGDSLDSLSLQDFQGSGSEEEKEEGAAAGEGAAAAEEEEIPTRDLMSRGSGSRNGGSAAVVCICTAHMRRPLTPPSTGGEAPSLSYWGGRGVTFADMPARLREECAGAGGGGGACVLPDRAQALSNALAVAARGRGGLALDVVLRRGGAGAVAVAEGGAAWGAKRGGRGNGAAAAAEAEALAARLGGWLAAGEAAFDARFEETYGLEARGFGEKEVAAAKAALSNLVGGMGYFHGRHLVRAPGERPGAGGARRVRVPSFPTSLFTAVPSRSFFPRGFLWDEGFHQLLVARWDPVLAADAIRHWAATLHVHRPSSRGEGAGGPGGEEQAAAAAAAAADCAGAWVPREQILGEAARRRVPAEFVPQDVDVANPPTLLLALRLFLDRVRGMQPFPVGGIYFGARGGGAARRGGGGRLAGGGRGRGGGPGRGKGGPAGAGGRAVSADRATLAFLSEVTPRLEAWAAWLLASQRPPARALAAAWAGPGGAGGAGAAAAAAARRCCSGRGGTRGGGSCRTRWPRGWTTGRGSRRMWICFAGQS
ncbi:unnamed protein product [Heterosigma akashiwo]